MRALISARTLSQLVDAVAVIFMPHAIEAGVVGQVIAPEAPEEKIPNILGSGEIVFFGGAYQKPHARSARTALVTSFGMFWLHHLACHAPNDVPTLWALETSDNMHASHHSEVTLRSDAPK